MYRNKYDLEGTNSLDGASAEHQFREIAERKAYAVEEASREQQFQHIDFLLKKDDKIWLIDVKARKKIRREDAEPTDEFCWLEFVSVNGKDGWLKGKAGFIALERKNDFIIVSRKLLLELAEKIVDQKSFVDRPHKALRKIYRRFKRKDQISYIEFSEIEKLTHTTWKKNEKDQS